MGTELRLDAVEIEWRPDGEREWAEWCQARAQVSYACDNDGNRRLEWLTSSGLHGIDVSTDNRYRQTIEDEELTDLREHLQRFGVDVSAFARLATAARQTV